MSVGFDFDDHEDDTGYDAYFGDGSEYDDDDDDCDDNVFAVSTENPDNMVCPYCGELAWLMDGDYVCDYCGPLDNSEVE